MVLLEEERKLIVRKLSPKETKDRSTLPSTPEKKPQAHMWSAEGPEGSSTRDMTVCSLSSQTCQVCKNHWLTFLSKMASYSTELDYLQV